MATIWCCVTGFWRNGIKFVRVGLKKDEGGCSLLRSVCGDTSVAGPRLI